MEGIRTSTVLSGLTVKPQHNMVAVSVIDGGIRIELLEYDELLLELVIMVLRKFIRPL